MKVATVGEWHLCLVVTAALIENGLDVSLCCGVNSKKLIETGRLPLVEGGIEVVAEYALMHGCREEDTIGKDLSRDEKTLVWILRDSDIKADEEARVAAVIEDIVRVIGRVAPSSEIAVSTQLALGSMRKIRKRLNEIGIENKLLYCPENLRLGEGTDSFKNQVQFVVGSETGAQGESMLVKCLSRFNNNIIQVSWEEAEMAKHALNAYLGLCVGFSNEIAKLYERNGIRGEKIAGILRADSRVGRKAYVLPGGPFHGGTLQRDIDSLRRLLVSNGEDCDILDALVRSNEKWKGGSINRIVGDECIESVCCFGLRYKEGSSVIRDSYFVENSILLARCGKKVSVVESLGELEDTDQFRLEGYGVKLLTSVAEALRCNYDALIINRVTPHERKRILDYLAQFEKVAVVDIDGELRR